MRLVRIYPVLACITGALRAKWGERVIFFLPRRLALHARFALCAKCRVRLAWLMKRSLCRLFQCSQMNVVHLILRYRTVSFLFNEKKKDKTCKQKRFHGWCNMKERILGTRAESSSVGASQFTDSLVASNQVQYVPCSRNRSLGLLGYACCQTASRFRWIHRARNSAKSCKRDKGQTLEGAVFGEWQIPTGIGGGRSYKERNLGRVSNIVLNSHPISL